MNILTFDIEEWSVEKKLHGGRESRYRQFDEAFEIVLNELEKNSIKATFFCLGKLATEFPGVIRSISEHGHEIGCHSDEHGWLTKMDEKTLRQDTLDAIHALEDVSGQRVKSYRAPAFSITENNLWAIDVLAECGIENDASIFPASRSIGGFAAFPSDKPCIISHNGVRLKEFPVCITSLFGKKIAYSGGGYFRLLPYWYINRLFNNEDYSIFYFHLKDLIHTRRKMMTRSAYEEYFHEPGTFINRFLRYSKNNIGNKNSQEKFLRIISANKLISLETACSMIDWGKVKTVSL